MATPAQRMLAAVKSGDILEVAALLNADACLCDLKDRTPFRWPVLHHAVSCGHADIAALLLTAGASVDRQDHYGQSALHLASHAGNFEMVRLLAAANATVQIVDNNGQQPCWANREIADYLRANSSGRIKYGRQLERNGKQYGIHA